MDNLTHSLTGVMATRVFPGVGSTHPGPTAGEKTRPGRTLFWLMLVSVNLPDADIVANLFTDPLTAVHFHRGFTHSFLMAPFVALLPSVVALLINRSARFPWLWIAATTGVLVHIFVDLITPYGTQIFFPVDEARYSLDWMFIIDPWFTGVVALLLVAGRILVKHRRALGFVTLIFTVLYIGAESRLHSRALDIFKRQLEKSGTPALNVAVLPQPFSMTEWMGLASTKQGPVRQYIRLFDEAGVVAPEFFPDPSDPYAAAAFATPYVSRYLAFARFPAVTSGMEKGVHAVEIRDLQFSVAPGIARAFGMEAAERDVPFVLRLEFAGPDSLASVTFNGRPVPPVEGLAGKPYVTASPR